MVKTVLDGIAAQLENALCTLNDLRLSRNEKGPACCPPEDKLSLKSALDVAIYVYQSRRARDRCFPQPEIFGEPAWDILLRLFIHQARGEKDSIESATIGAATSSSTAQRWLKLLEKEGLVSSQGDNSDDSGRYVSLTEEGCKRMMQYLAEAAR